MNASIQIPREERIEAVLALLAARQGAADAARLEGFARAYFHHLDQEDLVERRPEDLLGALLSHWQLGAQRLAGTPATLRVFSPSADDHGWSSRHTVLEIVNDDMPFLVDSTTMEINRQGLTLHLLVHPVYAVERDDAGRLLTIRPHHEAPSLPRESWMYIEVDRTVDAQQRAELAAGLTRVLADVRAAVEDWKPMLARLQQAAGELAQAPAALPEGPVAESRAFLLWLAQDRFTLLGYLRHDLVEREGLPALQPVPGSGLGVLREQPEDALSASFSALPPAARALARAPLPVLVVTKANTRATVHRAGYTDYVGVKRYDAQGKVVGEHRFIGLYSAGAYSARVDETPLLRGKVDAIVRRAGLAPGGHSAKSLQHILEVYPRDDLFQIPDEDLYETALGILALGERQRLRLFLWRDPFERFISCLVFANREAYSTDLRLKFQRILMQALHGASAEFEVLLRDANLARIHFTVRTTPGEVPAFDRREIERQLAQAARRWDDELREALTDADGEAAGLALCRQWGAAFPPAYRDRVSARDAVHDVHKLATISPSAPLALALYWPAGVAEGTLGFKVYRLGEPVVLSDSLPMLEHMGARVLREADYRIGAPGDATPVYLHDFELQARPADGIDPQTMARLFEEAFAQVFSGAVESDAFNRLVLLAGLAARQVVVLRAYAKYLRQIGFAPTQDTIAATLAHHPGLARQLVDLFQSRFHPESQDERRAAAQVAAIHAALEGVASLSEDTVLRQLLALVLATLRTNYWRTGPGHSGAPGPLRTFLSFKLDSARVPGLPQPHPWVEIFVYSVRFEGIHLRGGKVARGGLRWSDRADDFRTEVLGLVKAQMVKNTVIVPVGSKGGFVLKKAPPANEREALQQEGVACYQEYLRGLLDLTDNIVGAGVVPPPQVVRLDGDDPYLVVAADKGTASFSDHANAVSQEYGHWLGDAFASGGSVGYDHKAMGITARGAWESVKRHFRERGLDTQSQPFTVVGIGDMSGDVFGNGMLLSRQVRLVAAFDHRHVFIDPAPDSAASFAERERLFKLPRSSWADYDSSLISEGGGVWPRTDKSVPLSPQARAVLGIDAQQLAPAELISALLRAPVDLLYNGGIGTYVKARIESHADVGDRANDAVRVNGAELRCKVVAEGGNLGFTQRGRVEAALAGVQLYTDAIDNSGGVDTSDHEVNIKILLGMAVAEGQLTAEQRNALLPQMTEDVAALVLRDNYFQTQALSMATRRAPALLDEQARFIRYLEKSGRLDRAIEFLPGDEEIAERKARGLGLTSPEQAVLLAYSKMWLSDALIDSSLPEDPWVATALQRYFPALLQERFGALIPRHPLAREITATHVVNSTVNRVGATFIHRLGEISGAGPARTVRAYLAAREIFGLVATWQAIEALDTRVPDAVQAAMLLTLGELIGTATSWLLRSHRLDDPVEALIGLFQPAVQSLRPALEQQEGGSATAAEWIRQGVPEALAQRVAAAPVSAGALDVAEIAAATERPLALTAQVHRAVNERLGLDKLRRLVALLPTETYWHSLARVALADDLTDLQRAITQQALQQEPGAAEAVQAAWEGRSRRKLERTQKLLAELSDTAGGDLAALSVAMRELRNLV